MKDPQKVWQTLKNFEDPTQLDISAVLVYSIIQILFKVNRASYSFSLHPPSVSNILTARVHRNLLHTLLHTFCIKLRYFAIICITLIPSDYSHQTSRKSRKTKHLSHFQALQESHRKAQAYEFNKLLLVCFHFVNSSYIYGLLTVFSFLKNGLLHHSRNAPDTAHPSFVKSFTQFFTIKGFPHLCLLSRL